MNINVIPGVLSKLDPDLTTYLINLLSESFGKPEVINFITPGRYFLAGGCIRSYYDGTKVNDLDIYVLDTNTWETLFSKVDKLYEKYLEDIDWTGQKSTTNDIFDQSYTATDKAFQDIRHGIYKYPYKHVGHISFDKLSPRVEFLHVSYVPEYRERKTANNLPESKDLKETDFIHATTPNEILDGFDFICCQAGLEFTVEERALKNNVSFEIEFNSFKQHPLFLTCVAKKDLRFSTTEHMQKCGASYKRVYKYLSYGYKITRDIDFKLLEDYRRDAYLTGFDAAIAQYDT